MSTWYRRFAGRLAGLTPPASALALVGCGPLLNPKTTTAAPNEPIVPRADAALVVLGRPAQWNPDGGVLRVIDDQRHVLADLRVGEHAVVSLSPGAHELFAFDWSSGVGHPWCAGAMQATFSGGRVYAVRAAQYPSMSFHLPWASVADEFDCQRIELFRVSAQEHVRSGAGHAASRHDARRSVRGARDPPSSTPHGEAIRPSSWAMLGSPMARFGRRRGTSSGRTTGRTGFRSNP